MSKENKYRVGFDDKPLTKEEYERVRAGGSLYRRIKAPTREPKEGLTKKFQHNFSA